MDASLKKGVKLESINGNGVNVAIVSTKWNLGIVNSLVAGAEKTVRESGGNVVLQLKVSGAYELPFAAKSIILKSQRGEGPRIDSVIAIGCLIKGETMHFEYICESVTQGISRVGLETGTSVIFGVLACLTEQQAHIRAGLSTKSSSSLESDRPHNHGDDWGIAAIEMGRLKWNPVLSKL